VAVKSKSGAVEVPGQEVDDKLAEHGTWHTPSLVLRAHYDLLSIHRNCMQVTRILEEQGSKFEKEEEERYKPTGQASAIPFFAACYDWSRHLL
jgi:hypothetical protein